MSMNNGDMPAMPFVDNGFGQYKPEAYAGLTKREMMAMHVLGHIVKDGFNEGGNEGYYASRAVTLADALLKELSK